MDRANFPSALCTLLYAYNSPHLTTHYQIPLSSPHLDAYTSYCSTEPMPSTPKACCCTSLKTAPSPFSLLFVCVQSTPPPLHFRGCVQRMTGVSSPEGAGHPRHRASPFLSSTLTKFCAGGRFVVTCLSATGRLFLLPAPRRALLYRMIGRRRGNTQPTSPLFPSTLDVT